MVYVNTDDKLTEIYERLQKHKIASKYLASTKKGIASESYKIVVNPSPPFVMVERMKMKEMKTPKTVSCKSSQQNLMW